MEIARDLFQSHDPAIFAVARDWRKLRVEVKKPGLTVRARRGYVLSAAVEPARAGRKEGKQGKERKNAAPEQKNLDKILEFVLG